VCRFGVPKHLVSDNGTQFASHLLKKLCEDIGTQQVFASVEHPQTNGQVESANRVLLRGLKRKLEKAKGSWAEEVPRIVWAYHTTEQSGTHERRVLMRLPNKEGFEVYRSFPVIKFACSSFFKFSQRDFIAPV